MSEDAEFELLLSFDTDGPEFTRGFEVGVLWSRLAIESTPLRAVVHAANSEMVLRVAEARGLAVSSEELGDEWLEVVFR